MITYVFYKNSTGEIVRTLYELKRNVAQSFCELNDCSYIEYTGDADKFSGSDHVDVNVTPHVIVFGTKKSMQSNLVITIRSQRNALLKDSDWTQMADTPISTELKNAYAVYRQQLRDLPAQYPNDVELEDIVWPVKPS